MSTLGSCTKRKTPIRGGPAMAVTAPKLTKSVPVEDSMGQLRKSMEFIKRQTIVMPCWCYNISVLKTLRSNPEFVSLSFLDFAVKSIGEELKKHFEIIAKAGKSDDADLRKAVHDFWNSTYWSSKNVLAPEIRSELLNANKPVPVHFFISSANDQKLIDFDIVYDHAADLIKNERLEEK